MRIAVDTSFDVNTSPIGLHLDVVELVWIIGAVFGLVLALEALRDALADRRAVRSRARRVKHNGRELELERALAQGDVVSARWILGVEVLWLLIGAIAALQASPAAGRTLLSWVVVMLLVASAYALPLWLLGARRRRRRLLGIEDVDRG